VVAFFCSVWWWPWCDGDLSGKGFQIDSGTGESIPVPVRCSSPLCFGSVAGSGGRSYPISTVFCSVLVCWSGAGGWLWVSELR
jgi:hypothetical protein